MRLNSVPPGWLMLSFGSVLEDVTRLSGKVLARNYEIFGRFPIVDQGQKQIAGYSDDEKNLYSGELPVILFGDHTCRFKFVDFPFLLGADGTKILKVIHPNIDPKFVFYYFSSLGFQSESYRRHFSLLKKQEVPIPYPDDPARSLAEQRRIVARLEALLGEVREMRALQAQIEADVGRLMEAAIQDVFDQPNSDWQTAPLNEIAFIQTGTAKGRHFGGRKTVELPYLRVANVQAGYLDLDEIKTITIAEDEIEHYRLQPGDLLLTEGGDHDKLGRGAVWDGQIDLCIHQNHIFAVRFDPDVVLPRFAEYEMQSWHAKSYFLGVAKKTTNLATINKTKLGNFPLRYPMLAEQQAIVDRLDVVRAEMVELQKAQREDAASVEQLEQSVLAQAFTGQA